MKVASRRRFCGRYVWVLFAGIVLAWPPGQPSYGAALFEATLLFQTRGGLLAPEIRNVPLHPQDPVAQAREVLAALLLGPQDDRLRSPFPRETLVRGIFQSGSTLVVDMGIPSQGRWVGGAWEEYLAAVSLTSTVLMNFPELRQVKLLVDGTERESLAGHVDIRNPFALQRELVEMEPLAGQ